MGNSRFKLSDMMPNAWFYKLRDMGRSRSRSRSRNHGNIPQYHSVKKKQPTLSATAPQPSGPKHPHHQNCPRKSYYFTRELIKTSHDNQRFDGSLADATSADFPHDPPRRSSRQRVRRRSSRSSPKGVNSADCSCRSTLCSSTFDDSLEPELSYSFPPEFRSDQVLVTEGTDNNVSWLSAGRCKVDSDPNDIVITVDEESLVNKLDKLYVFDKVPDLDLPPIITKAVKFDDEAEDIKKQLQRKEPTKHRRSSAKNKERNARQDLSVKVVKEGGVRVKEQKTGSVRRHSVTSPGVRLRVNSPRIASSRRIQSHGRKSLSSVSNSRSRRILSDSFAIVKSSFDPQRDFRDSMMEMIVENNIKASKDLEDLLACYLSLNSDEYHDIIIKVFKQIWFDLTDTPVK